MSALSLPGCLITQPVQFNDPANFPPSIESAPAALLPLDDIIRIVADQDETLPEFEVIVRDPDVDQELEALVYVDYNPMSPQLATREDPIPIVDRAAGTDRRQRRYSFRLDEVGTGLRMRGCHRIELLVSSGFHGQTRLPDREGDIGTAVWWVATQSTTGDIVDMGSCQ